jgi:hypothetical protein
MGQIQGATSFEDNMPEAVPEGPGEREMPGVEAIWALGGRIRGG